MKEPVKEPRITHLLAKKMWERAQVPKPTALGTPLRFSSSFGCARQQGYYAFDAQPTEPIDPAGAWVTGIGTLIHEHLQAAISDVFPSAEFEVASGTDFISGSCDALISADYFEPEIDGTHVLWELKTMGTYSFDKQVGWNRMRGEWKYPEGPAKKAIAQAGMNALGIEGSRPEVHIEWIVMGSLTFEALSKNKADNMGVDEYNRFLAEFWIPREEWEPLAMRELRRANEIHESLTVGFLPDRHAVDDDGNLILLNPKGKNWQCDYCAFRTLCIEDGQDQVWITQSNLVRRNQD
jgi:hypothetical protein